MKDIPEPSAPSSQQYQLLSLALISPSDFNPRKTFDDTYIRDELAPSIKAHGILQPIVVRPIGERYAIVIGECRYRAAKVAGLETVPCLVRVVDDITHQKLALAENLRRKDLNQVEEGRAFKRLLDAGEPIESLMRDLGVTSKSTIYGRVKLSEAPLLLREAVVAGQLSPSVGLRIARIPGKQHQLDCAKEILQSDWLKTDSRAAEHIQRNYMTELKGAPFEPEDPELNPKRGKCST